MWDINDKFCKLGDRVHYLSVCVGLVLCGFVVPMLEVLVCSSFLRSFILLHHCPESTLSIGRVLVHSLVKGSIARVVFGFEFGWSHDE
jgi:hypothetical protein